MGNICQSTYIEPPVVNSDVQKNLIWKKFLQHNASLKRNFGCSNLNDLPIRQQMPPNLQK